MKVNIPVPKKIPFTRQGLEKVKNDYQALSEKRKEILIRLQAAREMGDLSENGAYTSAKFELRSTDRELRRLKFLLRFGEVKEKRTGDLIDFGSKVVLDDGNGKMTFMLVSGYESNPGEEKLSVNSPLGQAIVGKKQGDKVVIKTLDGEINYTILTVE